MAEALHEHSTGLPGAARGRCQAKEEKRSSVLIREVPRNICVLLIRHCERDEGSLFVDYFSLQHSPHTPAFPRQLWGETSLGVWLRKRVQ